MKLLQRVRLINWHYFTDETLDFQGGSVLLTGDNGSGKSTILDAIQYALVGDTRRLRFNQAAHEKSRRDLEGYLRCKIGEDQSALYLRTGDFTSYVALEFRDDRTRQTFVLGVGVDSRASGETERPLFFKADNRCLEDLPLLEDDRPATTREWRERLRKMPRADHYPTGDTYREAVRARLGHLSDRFFTVLTKGIAFKPVDNLRDFIYDYVLEENRVNIDVMRDNLHHYREFQHLVEQTEQKLAVLERVGGLHREAADWEERLHVQDYVVARAHLEDRVEHREQLGQEEQAARRQVAEDEPALKEATGLRDAAERQLRDLAQRKAENWAQQQINQITLKLEHARSDLARLQDDEDRLRRLSQEEVASLREAADLMRSPTFTWLPSDLTGVTEEAVAWVEALLVPAAETAPLVPSAQAEALAERLAGLADRVSEHRFDLNQQVKRLADEKAELQRRLADLAHRRLSYDEHTTRLRRLIAEEGSQEEPQVLCELLEIPREKWQDAVEGYLNTRRFDLIVRPEDFDRALAVYERRKREFRLHGVGLVNTGKIMEHLHDHITGSLAEEVQADNPHARAYINRTLGQVMKCETEQELKHHRIAITPTCMTYQNHTARQINPDVYETPFIGERALRRQRELKQSRLHQVETELTSLTRALEAHDRLARLLTDRRDRYTTMMGLWTRASGLPAATAEVTRLEAELAAVDRTELAEIEAAIARAEAEEARLDAVVGELRDRLAATRQRLKDLATLIPTADDEVAQRRLDLEALTSAWPSAVQRGAQRYLSERRRHGNAEIARRFDANRKTNASHLEKLREDLRQARSNYNRDYQFGGAIDAPDNAAYEAERNKLAESDLPTYREHISQAREAAEQEFKEHFIHRLHEHLEVAQSAFSDLNLVLKDIHFGQDRYEFTVRPAEAYRDYYKMIMDEYLMAGQTLFSEMFQERYRETIEDLFRRMLDVPEAEQQVNIDRLTDYRTYLEYDIRIHHGNGESTLFSKVNYEKSGGETQTPYYVAMLASFLQAYHAPYNADSARLVLFDEAFNRMDPDRVENMLSFLRSLGLQAVIAAPIDRCQLIAPHVPSTLLVMRHDHQVWVENYSHVLEMPVQPGQQVSEAPPPGSAEPATGFSQVAAAGDDDA